MTTTWLALAPLGIAVIVFVLQRLRAVSTLLTAVGLAAMGYLVIHYRDGLSLLVLGRSFDLSSLEAVSLAFCIGLALVMVVYGYQVAESDLAHPLILLTMAVFAISAMARNLAIGGLLLQIAAIFAVMLIPSERPRSAMAGMRALVLLVIAGCFLLLGSWALEGQTAEATGGQLANLGGIILAIGFGMLLAAMPFHIWQPPVAKHSTPLAIVVCMVVLNIFVMLRINNLLFATPWPGGKEYFTGLLLLGGLATAVLAGLLAIPQRSVHRTLAFSAVAEAGLALAGLALGTELGIRAALLHMFCRGLGVTVMAMSLGVFRQVLGGDDSEHLRGALRRTPLAVAGLVIAGLSLAGLPPTAGFATRFMLYRVLGQSNPLWALSVLAATVGPTVAFIRLIVSALTPVVSTDASAGENKRWAEPLLAGLLIVALSILLLAFGVRPELVMLPTFP